MAVALASRFWRLGCPKIYHEVATRLSENPPEKDKDTLPADRLLTTSLRQPADGQE
ncbi:hypothetical protein [Thiolapillus sp.]|uniref:hypothetical protein n=1 Tax=Thiolapillus sp. TaxID=2017437 RepID=UPI003AF84D67